MKPQYSSHEEKISKGRIVRCKASGEIMIVIATYQEPGHGFVIPPKPDTVVCKSIKTANRIYIGLMETVELI